MQEFLEHINPIPILCKLGLITCKHRRETKDFQYVTATAPSSRAANSCPVTPRSSSSIRCRWAIAGEPGGTNFGCSLKRASNFFDPGAFRKLCKMPSLSSHIKNRGPLASLFVFYSALVVLASPPDPDSESCAGSGRDPCHAKCNFEVSPASTTMPASAAQSGATREQRRDRFPCCGLNPLSQPKIAVLVMPSLCLRRLHLLGAGLRTGGGLAPGLLPLLVAPGSPGFPHSDRQA